MAKVRRALEGVGGVTKVDVNFSARTATVQGPASPDALLAALKRAGYDGQVR